MNKEVFNIIVQGLREFDPTFFACKPDCTRLMGFTDVQKFTAAI